MADLGSFSDIGIAGIVHTPNGTGRVIDWNDKLSGTISLDGSPYIMRVSAYTRGGTYVASTTSNALGVWSMTAIQERFSAVPLQIIGHDDSGTDANAVIQDFVYTVA